ncbi:MAG TPA: hypothetical protein VNT79_02145 [Phycisphaerae bacterium]|nr:hypothetical protein [Phycisphaerae bacterium]
MPLQQKCNSCGRTLILEEVFRGAFCRCKHCRRLLRVPAAQPRTRTAPRPEHPEYQLYDLADAPPAAVQAVTSPAVVPVIVKVPKAVTGKLTRLRLVASFVLTASSSLGVAVWALTGPPAPHQGVVVPLAASLDKLDDGGEIPENFAAENPRLAIARMDPLRSYFGIPLRGKKIGYVMDGDATMSPYGEKLAFVTNSVNGAMSKDVRGFGVVRAEGNRRAVRVIEDVQPARQGAAGGMMLSGRLAADETNLTRAYAVTREWHADELFIVLSKWLPAVEVSALEQLAAQGEAVTHVIALGHAAENVNLRRVAEAGGGQFVAISDGLLDALVGRHEKAGPESAPPEPSH